MVTMLPMAEWNMTRLVKFASFFEEGTFGQIIEIVNHKLWLLFHVISLFTVVSLCWLLERQMDDGCVSAGFSLSNW